MRRRVPAKPKVSGTVKMCSGCGNPKARCECLELALLQQIRVFGLPEPVREFRFAPPRRWRADFYFPTHNLIVECEGGIYRGRHTSPTGYTNDAEKYTAASLDGFKVARFTSMQIRSGEAIKVLEAFFGKDT